MSDFDFSKYQSSSIDQVEELLNLMQYFKGEFKGFSVSYLHDSVISDSVASPKILISVGGTWAIFWKVYQGVSTWKVWRNGSSGCERFDDLQTAVSHTKSKMVAKLSELKTEYEALESLKEPDPYEGFFKI